jgi:hypothetical protein
LVEAYAEPGDRAKLRRSRDAIGIGGALQKLAQQPYSPYLLGLAAAGLCYGLYCLVDARYRDVSAGR